MQIMALRLFGYEISRTAHSTTYDGLPTSKKLEILSLEEGLPMQLHGVINELKQRYTMEMVHTICKTADLIMSLHCRA